MLNAEKVYNLLFRLLEKQEEIEIAFTIDKKEDRKDEKTKL